jgi:hypothetical protein
LVQSNTIRYGDGTTAFGGYVKDALSISGLIDVPEFCFIDAVSVTDATMDGIVGLGLPGYYSLADSMLAKLQSQKVLTSNVFSWFLDNRQVIGGKNHHSNYT